MVTAVIPLSSCASEKYVRAEINYSNICKQYYAAESKKITGKVFIEQKSRPTKPAKGQVTTNPYNTCLLRATDHTREGVAETKRKLQFMRNDYSRRNPFSDNGKYFFVYSRGGNWHLYDSNSLEYVRLLPFKGDAEPIWDPQGLNIYFIPNNGGTTLLIYSVELDRVTKEIDFEDKLTWKNERHIWTRSEGSPSADSRYWVFNVDDEDFNGLGMFTFDMLTNKVIAEYDYTKNNKSRPNHVSMSPSGKFVVSSWASEGTYSFNIDFSNPKLIYASTQHSDIAINKDGQDVYIWAHYSNVFPRNKTGWVVLYNLEKNIYQKLFKIYDAGNTTSMHFSGKSFDKPGWVLVSTYNNYIDNNFWYNNKIFAVELKESPEIINLSNTYNKQASYWSEVHASVNRDFTRILLNSNWGNSSPDNLDAYIIFLPDDYVN